MRDRFRNIKAIVLAGLIIFGVMIQSEHTNAQAREELIVAGGCFWCVESDFESVRGVQEAISGFTGGTTANPTYKQVSRGGTGHYEAVRILYDPSEVSRDQLLSLFFRSVDPTDSGGQFCDRGDSYRTAVFAGDDAEKTAAELAKTSAEVDLGQEVVTPILPKSDFYPADAFHQDYYKGKKIILTRFGPKRQSEAYKTYRQACGRDTRVVELWGADAPFVKKYLK